MLLPFGRGLQHGFTLSLPTVAPVCWPILGMRPQYVVKSGAGLLVLRSLWITVKIAASLIDGGFECYGLFSSTIV
jgi:hypothetical protein